MTLEGRLGDAARQAFHSLWFRLKCLNTRCIPETWKEGYSTQDIQLYDFVDLFCWAVMDGGPKLPPNHFLFFYFFIFACWDLSSETALDRHMEIMARWLCCRSGLLKTNLTEKGFFYYCKHLCGSDLLVKIKWIPHTTFRLNYQSPFKNKKFTDYHFKINKEM